MNDQEEHALIAQRRAKLNALREAGNAFPNDFRRDAIAGELHAEYDQKSNEVMESSPVRVKVAGRLMAKRVMGKASFAQLQDMSGRIQLFLQRDTLPEGVYQDFKGWDIGDIVGAVIKEHREVERTEHGVAHVDRRRRAGICASISASSCLRARCE